MSDYLLEVDHLPSVFIPALVDFNRHQDDEDNGQEPDHRRQTGYRHLHGTHHPRVIWRS